MDAASIGAAVEGLKYAKDALRVYIDAKADSKAREEVERVRDRLGVVQDVMYELREELLRKQTETEELRRALDAAEVWGRRAAMYRLTQTAGGAVVYQNGGPPLHYACPGCFEMQQIQILQDRRVMSGIFDCPSCGTSFPVNPHKPFPSVRTTRGLA